MEKTYKSPAKVNLSLKVLGKRADGYHELETLMARISLYDTLTFKKSDTLSLQCDFPGVPLDDSNLVIKALKALEAHVGREMNYAIHLEKHIPHGAGLAGGSSNAATTLMALNELENLHLSKEVLATIAAKLGADVSFFLYETSCLCRGIGEIVEPISLAVDKKLLLIKPDFGVNTPAAYKAWQSSKKIKGISYLAQQMPWGEMVNDLERPVFAKHRFLAELKMWLLAQPEVEGALMSGSGSTVFAILSDTQEEFLLVNKLKNEINPLLWTHIASIDA
ncbi:4-(cytidine 5'-diphospho)-2-C-methyl-D-erythritol kinase [Akkermansiaceae bacterium]|nr:4-(cytidine 5'-diphospho)-2-C-methyl-D-erythritol kinase [Akkermansiaceae bacterium]